MLMPSLCAVLLSSLLAQPNQSVIEGRWEMWYYDGLMFNVDRASWIIDLQFAGKNLDGKMVTARTSEAGVGVESVNFAKDRVRINLTPNKSDMKRRICQFDGIVSDNTKDTILGCLQINERVYPARLQRTKLNNVEKLGDYLHELLPASKKLRWQTLRSFEVVDGALPDLEKVVREFPDSPAATAAAEFLVRQAVSRSSELALIEGWAKAGQASAKRYGPRYHAEYSVRLVGILPTNKDTAPLALHLLGIAESSLDETYPLHLRSRFLWLKDAAMRAANAKPDAAVDALWQKLDAEALAQYRKISPLPKLGKYDAKPGEGKRVAVVEWITGRNPYQQRRGVAEAALDGLAETYSADHLVMIEYAFDGRKQIPFGDAIGFERAMEYQNLFRSGRVKKDQRVSNPFFVNGIDVGGLNHYQSSAQEIYDALRSRVDATFVKPADININARIKRQGEKITVEVSVANVPNPARNAMRVLLVESHGHYGLPSGILTQKRIVRASQRAALKEKSFEKSVEFDLAVLDVALTPTSVGIHPSEVLNPLTTVQNFVRQRRWIRPQVFVLVENDAFGEILQAVRLDVPRL